MCAALRDDLYLDVGCLLALSLAHGGPPVGFFSPALYRCLFNYPPGPPLGLTHMTPGTLCTRRVGRVSTSAAGITALYEHLHKSAVRLPTIHCKVRLA